jgi:hypothetical protein
MLINLEGRRFARLLVISRVFKKTTDRAAYWLCRCDCGQEKIVQSGSLRSGHTKSCGCLRNELSGDRFSIRSRLPIPWLASRNVLIHRYKNRAQKDERKFTLTDEECHTLFQGSCAYCGSNPSNSINYYFNKKGERIDRKKPRQVSFRFDLNTATYLFNGIDRINNDIDYFYDNCTSCCMICNRAKSNMSLDKWNSYLTQLIGFNSGGDRNNGNSITPLEKLEHQRASFNRLIASYTRSAKKRDFIFELSLEECHSLFKSPCYYCGALPTNTINNCLKKDGSPKKRMNSPVGALYTYIYNGIDRKDPTLGYLKRPGQCVSCCLPCNMAKSSMPITEFEDWIDRITNFQKTR